MLASVDFDKINMGGQIAMFVSIAALLVGTVAWCAWLAGGEVRTRARSTWGRRLCVMAFHAGRAGTVVAGVVFVRGIIFAVRSESPYEARLSKARSDCRKYYQTHNLERSEASRRVESCAQSHAED